MARPTQPILTGVKELDKMLLAVGTTVGNKAARTVLGKGTRLAAKRIKAKVPSSHKAIRKAIGSSVKKQKGGADRGITKAKAGAAVGRANKTQGRGKRSKGGVGIGARNVHWYILGTDERIVKATGQYAGRMPANPIVKEAMAASGGEVLGLMKREMRPAIEKETQKEARRQLKKRRR